MRIATSNLSIYGEFAKFHEFVMEIISDRTSGGYTSHVGSRAQTGGEMVDDWGRGRRRTPVNGGRNYCHRNAVTLSLFSGRSRRGVVGFIGRGSTARLSGGDLSSIVPLSG